MATYSATFSNGKTITRNSAKQYAFAWRREDAYGNVNYGFTATKDQAEKQARNAGMKGWVVKSGEVVPL